MKDKIILNDLYEIDRMIDDITHIAFEFHQQLRCEDNIVILNSDYENYDKLKNKFRKYWENKL
jgi:hypothetical protein